MTPFDCFTEDIAKGRHNLGTDQLVVALSNTAPNSSDTVISDIVEINYVNCSSRNVTVSSSGQTDGVYSLVLQNLVLTASGGNVGPFRYVVLYNATSTGGRLIGWVDLGSERTIQSEVDPLEAVAVENNAVLLIDMYRSGCRVMGTGSNIDALVNAITGTVVPDSGTPAQYDATGLSGKPCAEFGGSSAYITTSDPDVIAALTQPGAFTCFIYGAVNVADALQAFLGAGNAESNLGTLLIGTSNNAAGVWAVRAVLDGGGSSNGNFGANDTSPHLLTYQCTGTVRNLWVDGVADPANGFAFAPTVTPTRWSIGNVPDDVPSEFLDGKIAIVVLCDGALDETQRAAIWAAITAKVAAA